MEVQFTAGNNIFCPIQNISKDKYLDKETGEIKERKNKLGEFENKPSEYPKLVRKVKKYCVDGKEAVYGLENAYGYGRNLAKWLSDKGYIVKDVNLSLSHREAKHRATYKKSDKDDASAVAIVTINMLHELPNACPNDAYWALGQLTHRRDSIMSQLVRFKNQLHELLCISYPSYKKFFTDIGRDSTLFLGTVSISETFER